MTRFTVSFQKRKTRMGKETAKRRTKRHNRLTEDRSMCHAGRERQEGERQPRGASASLRRLTSALSAIFFGPSSPAGNRDDSM